MRKWWHIVLPAILVGGGVLCYFIMTADSHQERDVSAVQTMITQGQVSKATLYDKQHLIEVATKNGDYKATFLSDNGEKIIEQLQTAKTPFEVKSEKSDIVGSLFSSAMLAISGIVPILIMIVLFVRYGPGLMSGSLNGNTDYDAARPEERFSDVVGADEAIDNLKILVDLLQNPKTYEGLKIERGVLFEGPTGTGKTMLAKAVAGESNAPFYHLSGAGLTSMFAGGTSQRIEKFFEKIRKDVQKSDPVVIFVDEIDGIASKRVGQQGADRDSNTSVTQLLHQITDLFSTYPLAILIGATNNINALDDAVIRPGRFGMHIAMPNPDQTARQKLLELNSANLTVGDVNMEDVAKLTAGMSGASVASIPSKAAVLARQQRGAEAEIKPRDIERATMEIVQGTLRWSAAVTDQDLMLSAVHEAGHAVLAQRSPYHQLLVVTTVPIGQSGGSTWCPPIDQMCINHDSLMWRMAVAMAGRESEIQEFNTPSSGPAHDIENATNLATLAICEWGIYDDFVMKIDPRCWVDTPRADEIDAKMQSLVNEARVLARQVLNDAEALRTAIIAELGKHRILHSDDIAKLVSNNMIVVD